MKFSLPDKFRAFLIWALVSVLMITHFFLMLSVGVITTELRDALKISALELSVLSSSYLYIYLILQTPVGVLIDIFGSRKLLTLGAIASAIGCWIFAYSNSLALSIFARVLTGFGTSFVFVSAIQLAGKWFQTRYLGLMIGLAETSGVLGAIIGNITLALFIDKIGWRDSFNIAGFILLTLAGLVWLWVRDRPVNYLLEAMTKPSLMTVVKNLKIIIREPYIWYNSGYMALSYSVVTVFSGLWANPFLRKAYDLNLEQATLSCSMLLVGFGIGAPFVGAIANTLAKRLKFMQYTAGTMLVLLCILIYVPYLNYTYINIIMFVTGMSCTGVVLSFAIVSESAPAAINSTSVGFVNTKSLLSAIIFQPAIGWILGIMSTTVTKKGIEVYTVGQYRTALSVIPVLIFLALIVAILMNRRFKEQTA